MSISLSNRDLLDRLVAIDSTSCKSNLPLADFICEYVDRPGFDISRQFSPDGDKVNVVVTVGPQSSPSRLGLALSGHMDTVPADEPGWDTDPHQMVERDGKYWGRGTCDMKGFIALAINAAISVNQKSLTQPLALVFSYDEEVGIVGAKHLCKEYEQRFELPKATIVGEPTSLKAVRMHKGYLDYRITLNGQSAHSGYPHLGVNAIEPLGQLITALSKFRRELESESPPNTEFFPEVPYVAFNVGTVVGGTATNIVPDKCIVDCSARPLPGMDNYEIVARLDELVGETLKDFSYEAILTKESPPLLLGEEAPIYRYLCDRVGQTETHSASYATDAGWMQTVGMDCTVFGPGSIEVAHRPNEFIPISEFDLAYEILQSAIQDFCLDGD